jgi:hypothetical protein
MWLAASKLLTEDRMAKEVEERYANHSAGLATRAKRINRSSRRRQLGRLG